MSQKKIEARGARKEAVASAWVLADKSKKNAPHAIFINGKELNAYFKRPSLSAKVVEPFKITETEGQYALAIAVKGGGVNGQAEAARHAVANLLVLLNPYLRSILRKAGFLTRNSKQVESKKAGLLKARKKKPHNSR